MSLPVEGSNPHREHEPELREEGNVSKEIETSTPESTYTVLDILDARDAYKFSFVKSVPI